MSPAQNRKPDGDFEDMNLTCQNVLTLTLELLYIIIRQNILMPSLLCPWFRL